MDGGLINAIVFGTIIAFGIAYILFGVLAIFSKKFRKAFKDWLDYTCD